jgi:hypothetical protein
MKGQMLLTAIAAFLASFVTGTIVTKESGNWTHIVKLDPENGFIAKWFNTPEKPDGSHWIEMEISANTRGYLGLGFSPKGGMAGADIVIGWVDGMGKAHLRVSLTDNYDFLLGISQSYDFKRIGDSVTDYLSSLGFSWRKQYHANFRPAAKLRVDQRA